MTTEQFLERIRALDSIPFAEVVAMIDRCFDYTPTGFSNGLGNRVQLNEPGQNVGSCKLLAFALIYQLDQQQTLNLFGEHYQDVLDDPDGDSHLNIRAFMADGWAGVRFDAEPLRNKADSV